MFGFPPILDGNAGIKFTNNADSGFPKPGIREIFYSVRDGNWTDVGIWETASGRVGLTPTANDDVYIRNIITATGGLGTTLNCNNLIITNNGTLNGGSILNVFGNLLSYGTLNFLPNAVNFANGYIALYGVNNYIDKTKQTATIFYYRGLISQPIIDANYSAICFGGLGEKYLTCDLLIGSMFGNVPTGNYWFNLKNFNFTCNAAFDTTNSSLTTYVEGNQTLIFKGFTRFYGGIYCSNNPTFEFQNGVEIGTGNNNNLLRWNFPYGLVNSYLGTGVIRFTTNSQTLTSGFVSLTLDNTIEIANNITLTVIYAAGAGTSLNLTGTINGLGANSRLTNGLNSVLNFATATAATTAMSTGLFDFTTNVNTIQYNGNYSATIPSYFTTFRNLTILGTGTKTLGVNTTLTGNLRIGSLSVTGILECSTFNLSVNGTTYIGVLGSTFSKNGVGNLLFVGNVTGDDAGAGGSRFNLSGNPNVELRGGANVLFYGGAGLWNTGTGTWTFTTNPQTLTFYYIGYNFNCTTIISGVTVTIAAAVGGGALTLNGTIDGTNASSILNLNGRMNLANATQVLPMFTNGTFNPINAATSLLGFTFNGNYTLPYTTLNGLAIGGTGTKTLGGNTTVTSFTAVGSNSTFELSTFDFTNNGVTNITAGSLLLSKTGAGTVTFVGLVSITAANTFGGLSFTGNPNVELRAGFTNGGAAITTWNTGTGTWSFTTANQTLTMNFLGGAPGSTWNCTILISGTITLTLSTVGSNFTSNGVINGSVAGSTLLMGASANLFYNNTVQPMATGILDTSTNLNTFIYGSGAQNIKGGPSLVAKQVYRNLTLNGGGVKTLQGYVSVLNTYTLTSPATLALNGFTLTNP